MGIAGTINQHGKITISLGTGNVATLKGDLDETDTDTAGIAGQLDNQNCMSYGPGCLEAAHQPDEWAVIDDIIRCEKVYHQLISSNIL